jgi:hypothetical protein
MKTVLISFATNDRWEKSQNNLNKSAIINGINSCISYNPENLDKDFKNTYKHLLNSSVRGYGYWMWKPMIIKQTLNLLNDNDIVLYVDSGNTIIHNLDYLIEEVNKKDILLFDNRDGNYRRTTNKNRQWTKRDCYVLMNCDEEKYHNSDQIDASYQIYKKNKKTINFIDELLGYCCNENIISDLPNITKNNLPEFIDHRHDQSILSLMAHKHNIELLPEPSEWGNYLDRPYPQLFDHHRAQRI